MEKIFSLDNMSKNIFTESVSTFREFPNILSKNHDVYSNAIKQAIVISDNTIKANLEEAFKDSLYRIKETEKNISKNILFEDYAFNLKFVRPNISEINKPICVYHYKNLCDSNSPNLFKLNEKLDKILTVLTKFQSIGTPEDKHEFCEFLKEKGEKLIEKYHKINDDILGCSEDTDSTNNLDFIKNSFYHFRDIDNNPLGKEYSAGIPTRDCIDDIKSNHTDIPQSVSCYNSDLTSAINKINKILGLLNSIYTDYDSEVKEAKNKFKCALILYASKYLSHANIAYSIKYINIHNFLNPSNDFENKTELVEGYNMLDDLINDNELITESLFEDMVSSETKDYKKSEYYIPSLLMMESEYIGLVTQEIINEADAVNQNNTNTNTQQPAQQSSAVNQKINNNDTKLKMKQIWSTLEEFFLKIFNRIKNKFNRYALKANSLNLEKITQNFKNNNYNNENIPQFAGNYSDGIQKIEEFKNAVGNKNYNFITSNSSDSDEFNIANKLFGSGAVIVKKDDNVNLAEFSKNYFLGNQPNQIGQEVKVNPPLNDGSFKTMLEFCRNCAMFVNDMNTKITANINTAKQQSEANANKIHESYENIEIANYYIENVLKEYFGDSYKSFIEEPQNDNTTNQQNNSTVNNNTTDNNKEVTKPVTNLNQTSDTSGDNNDKNEKIENSNKVATKYMNTLKTISASVYTALDRIVNDYLKVLEVLSNGKTTDNTNNTEQQDNVNQNK